MSEKERDIDNSDLSLIDAEFVRVSQSTVRSVEGGHVELQQVGAMSIDGDRVEVTQGAACFIKGGDVRLSQSMNLITAGDDTTVESSFVPIVLSRGDLDMKQSASCVVGARNLKAENTTSVFLLAGNVEGDVQTVFDWKSTLSLGAVIGGIIGFVSLLRKR